MQALSPLVPRSRLDAYRDNTGVDLTSLNSALVAGFDLGTLYLAEDPGDLAPVELAFRERLIAEVDTKNPHPALTRVNGVVGRTPQGLLLYDGHWIAASVGDPTLLNIVEAFTRKKLKRAVPALRGAGLSPLADFSERAPLRLLVPGPFEGRWMLAAEGLLAAADGVALAASPKGAERVAVSLAIEGPWDTTREVSPAEKLRLAWEDLAASSTGKLFGLDTPLTPPTIENTKTRVTLSTELELQPIVAGLHAAVSAEIGEILSPSERSSEPPKAEP
jgi:hypothetical protein